MLYCSANIASGESELGVWRVLPLPVHFLVLFGVFFERVFAQGLACVLARAEGVGVFSSAAVSSFLLFSFTVCSVGFGCRQARASLGSWGMGWTPLRDSSAGGGSGPFPVSLFDSLLAVTTNSFRKDFPSLSRAAEPRARLHCVGSVQCLRSG